MSAQGTESRLWPVECKSSIQRPNVRPRFDERAFHQPGSGRRLACRRGWASRLPEWSAPWLGKTEAGLGHLSHERSLKGA
jgi:hypothetical protein